MRLTARAGHAFAVVSLTFVLSFAALHLVPGDPLAMMVEQLGRTDAGRAALRARYGLDASIGEQMIRYLANILRGDLGTSIASGQSVGRLVLSAIERSALLGASALLIAFVVGATVGTAHGWWPRSRMARIAGTALTALYAVPEFILAVAMLFVLAYRARWFPVGGFADPRLSYTGTALQQMIDVAHHVLLPALTLGIGWSAAVARQQRHAIADVSTEPHIRTAQATGAGQWRVLWLHGVRVTWPSLLSTLALIMPAMFGGAVVIEVLFSWPGIGTLLVQAITTRDYPVASGAMLAIGCATALATLGADALRWLADPRLRTPVVLM